jgi:hypothetical protein
MAAFVTLCEAYIGIEPPMNLLSHFFQAQLWHDSGMGAASLGSRDVLVHSGPRANSHFSVPQPDPSVGWWKAWFLLMDEADAPLPTIMGGCPIPDPDWEHGVARADFPQLQPLLEIVWGYYKRDR